MPPLPEHVTALARAHRPGHAMAQDFYTDDAVFAADREMVFGRNWMLAGHVSEIPDPGDYVLFEILDESIILCRDEAGGIRALANVCRHRGSRVCLEPRGHARRFTCPYHAWVYNLDGSLFSARLLDAAHDTSKLGLRAVAVEVLEGLIYVSLSDDPPDFAPLRAALEPRLRPFRLDRTRIAHRAAYPVRANWKLVVENYNECYHCAAAHPEYSRAHAGHMPRERAGPLNRALADRAGDGPLAYDEVDAVGLHAPEGAEEHAHNRHALLEGYLTGSPDGRPVAPLLGDLTGYDGGATDVYVGVLNPMLIYSDHAVLYRFLPIDRDNSVQEILWLVHEDAQEGRDYHRDALTWLWDVTTIADKRIIEDNQKGVNSRFYEPGPLVAMEGYTRRFIDAYLGMLLDGGDRP